MSPIPPVPMERLFYFHKPFARLLITVTSSSPRRRADSPQRVCVGRVGPTAPPRHQHPRRPQPPSRPVLSCGRFSAGLSTPAVPVSPFHGCFGPCAIQGQDCSLNSTPWDLNQIATHVVPPPQSCAGGSSRDIFSAHRVSSSHLHSAVRGS